MVAVLWVSTPLSPQRAASKPIYVREPVLRTGQDQIPEYQAIWKFRQGRTRTYGVSDVTDLQSATFAAR